MTRGDKQFLIKIFSLEMAGLWGRKKKSSKLDGFEFSQILCRNNGRKWLPGCQVVLTSKPPQSQRTPSFLRSANPKPSFHTMMWTQNNCLGILLVLLLPDFSFVVNFNISIFPYGTEIRSLEDCCNRNMPTSSIFGNLKVKHSSFCLLQTAQNWRMLVFC